MQQIKAWKTSDGKIFDHKEKAEDHEIEIELKKFLVVGVPATVTGMKFEFEQDPIGFIISRKHVLLSILKGEEIEEIYPTQNAALNES